MPFDNETIEAGYVEKSPPRCMWYDGVCPSERRCDGNGSTSCRIKERGTLSSRMEGEYKRITFRETKIRNIPCISFLTEQVYQARFGASA